MDPREVIRNVGTGDVEVGLGPLKRRAAELARWVCEHCGTPSVDRGKSVKTPCNSKSGRHKWRSG